MRVTRDGRPALLDRTILGGPGAFDPVMTGGAPVVGTFVVVTPDAAVARELVGALRGGGNESGPGITLLHRDAGMVARMLGHDTESIQREFHRLWDVSRRTLLGAGAFDLRKR